MPLSINKDIPLPILSGLIHGRPQEFFQGGANLWGGPKNL